MKFSDVLKNSMSIVGKKAKEATKAVALEFKTYKVKKAIDLIQSNGLKVVKDTPKPTTKKKGK